MSLFQWYQPHLSPTTSRRLVPNLNQQVTVSRPVVFRNQFDLFQFYISCCKKLPRKFPAVYPFVPSPSFLSHIFFGCLSFYVRASTTPVVFPEFFSRFLLKSLPLHCVFYIVDCCLLHSLMLGLLWYKFTIRFRKCTSFYGPWTVQYYNHHHKHTSVRWSGKSLILTFKKIVRVTFDVKCSFKSVDELWCFE